MLMLFYFPVSTSLFVFLEYNGGTTVEKSLAEKRLPKQGSHDDSEEQSHQTSKNEDEEQERQHLQFNIFNLWVEPPSRNGTRTHESIAEEEWSYPSLSDLGSHHTVDHTPDHNADRATLASTLKEDRIDLHSPPNSMARNYSPSSSSKFQESIYSPFSVYSKQQKLGNSIGLDQLSGGGEQGSQNRHPSQKDADSRSVASSVYVMMEVKGSTTSKNEEDGKSVASTLLIDRQPSQVQ